MSVRVNDDGAAGPLGAATRWVGRHPRLVDAALAVAVGVLLLPTSVGVIAAAAVSSRWRLTGYLAVVALHLGMVSRRSRPRTSYGVGCAAMLVLTGMPYLSTDTGQAVPGPFLPTALVFFGLLYTVAEQRSAREAAAALLVALAGGGIVLTRLATGPAWWSQLTSRSNASVWLLLTALIVAGSVGAYSLGRLRRTRQAYLSELRERARRTEADRAREATEAADAERQRIAREMHDVVSHSLAVMISQAEGGRMSSPDGPSAAVLRTVADTGRAAMADMRAMLGVLGHPVDTTGSRAPLPGLGELGKLVERVRSTGCDVRVSQTGTPVELPATLGLTAYRVLQESLTNVVKHAGPAASAQVLLRWEPQQLTLEVSDDGVASTSAGRGHGLTGMAERVAALGGTLCTGPSGDPPGRRGWQVSVALPLGRERVRT